MKTKKSCHFCKLSGICRPFNKYVDAGSGHAQKHQQKTYLSKLAEFAADKCETYTDR